MTTSEAPEEWSPKTPDPPTQGRASSDDIVKVVNLWRDQRESYPGWAIAPTSKRRRIWYNTEYWIPAILAATIPSPNDLFAAFELDWRVRQSLIHPIPEVLDWIERILTRYHPFHKQVPEELRSGGTSTGDLPWEAMCNCWVELIFTVAKGYRLRSARQKFDHWMESVLQKEILSRSPEWVAKWCYEKCMYCMVDLDPDALQRTVEEWPATRELPLYEIKRGGICIELGEYERGEKIIRDAINELRKRTNLTSVTYNVTDLSQESVALLSLQLIQDNPFPDEATELDRPEFERRKTLRRHECDPLKELMSIKQSLASAPGKSPEEAACRVTFDGCLSYSRTMLCGSSDELRYALEFSNFFEESGLPFRGKHGSLADKGAVKKAAGILAEDASPWALACIARSQDSDAVDQLFSRTSVARMSQKDVDCTLAHYITILAQGIERVPLDRDVLISRPLPTQLCRVLMDVISRLVIRSSPYMQERVFAIGLRLWDIHYDVVHFVLHDSVRNLFERLLQSADMDQWLRWMPSLLSLRPADKAHSLAVHHKGEPLLSIPWPDDYTLSPTFDRSSWTKPIKYLLDLVESGDDLERQAAIVRLGRLYKIGALSAEEVEHIAEGIWKECRVDQTTGLPLSTGYYDGGLLELPHLNDVDLENRIKRKLLAGEFPLQKGTAISITEGNIPFAHELVAATPGILVTEKARRQYVTWSTDEVLQILDRIVEWWDADKARLSGPDEAYFSTKEEFLSRFTNIPTMLSHIVLPRLGVDTPEVHKQRVARLLRELSDHGVPCLRARVAALTLLPSAAQDVSPAMVEGLASQEFSHAQDACVAVAVWGIFAKQYHIPQLPEYVLRSLDDIIYFRRLPALRPALRESCVLFAHNLVEDIDNKILVGLGYLADETSLDTQTTTIRRAERPGYRRQAAKLSWAMHTYCRHHNIAVPPAIDQWRCIARSDPLPEVRREWPRND